MIELFLSDDNLENFGNFVYGSFCSVISSRLRLFTNMMHINLSYPIVLSMCNCSYLGPVGHFLRACFVQLLCNGHCHLKVDGMEFALKIFEC